MTNDKNYELLQGNCLTLMQDIPDASIDMILCDLPYGTTQNSWDCLIDLDKLWKEYNRIIKNNGCIALWAQAPFSHVLSLSNIKTLDMSGSLKKLRQLGI